MIIKSLGRKARTRAYGSHGVGSRAGRVGGASRVSQSAFSALARYMNRGIEDEEGQAVLWHNFPGGEQLTEDELVAEFEANARGLRERKNGNVLYHEILSFSAIQGVEREKLARHIADVGQEYLRERAVSQLAYGVIHHDTDHIHLHLMVSANAVRSKERVRLSKAQFAEVQRKVEAFTLNRYPELQQTVIYDKPKEKQQTRERVKATSAEQAMQEHRGIRARKIDLAAKLHAALEQARDFKELASWCQKEGIRFYERGKTIGIIVTEPGGNERKHRLETLGVLPHYQITNERLAAQEQGLKRETAQRVERPIRQSAERPVEPPEPNARDTVSPARDHVAEPTPTPAPTVDRDGNRNFSTNPKRPEPKMIFTGHVTAKAAEMAEGIKTTTEQAVDRTGEILKEEARFGKEVVKDFMFGPDRTDRRPHHEKPPEPTPTQRAQPPQPQSREPAPQASPPPELSEREQRLEALRQSREQAKGKDRDIDRDR